MSERGTRPVLAGQPHRDRVVRRLIGACLDGRLEPRELATRAEAVQRAATSADLDRLTADIPRPHDGAVGLPRRRARRLIVAVLTLVGHWRIRALAPRVLAVAAAGEVVIDLHHIAVTSYTTEITAVAVLAGEVRVIVPPGFEVRTQPDVTIGGRAASGPLACGHGGLAPAIAVRSIAVFGNVLVRQEPGRAGGPGRQGAARGGTRGG